jgi:hypothetical protein
MKEPKFEIFSGRCFKDAVWLESVEGQSNAVERMERISAEKPGQYFVYSVEHGKSVAETETFKKADTLKEKWAEWKRRLLKTRLSVNS